MIPIQASQLPRRGHGAFAPAFSLIEVVLALAVMSFALVAVVGLFSVGLQTNKESADQLHATDVTSLLIAARRSSPTNVFGTPALALPPLDVASTATTPLNLDGTVGSVSTAPFKLKYVITPSTATPKVANLYLLVWWPGSAAAPLTNTPGAYYQVTTQISLP